MIGAEAAVAWGSGARPARPLRHLPLTEGTNSATDYVTCWPLLELTAPTYHGIPSQLEDIFQ